MQINQIIIRPVMTEKATDLSKRQVYSFVVHKKANAHQIRTALETFYKIKIKQVRILNRKGKKKRVGRKMKPVQLPDTKIAFIVVQEGKIELFPQT